MLPLNRVFQFDKFRDARGELSVFEGSADFPLCRVFWIRDVPVGATRGSHAALFDNEILVLTAGSCRVDLHDGVVQRSFALETPMSALLIPKMTWRTLYAFSPDCVLTVLADQPYRSDGVITDFDAFIAAARHSRTY